MRWQTADFHHKAGSSVSDSTSSQGRDGRTYSCSKYGDRNNINDTNYSGTRFLFIVYKILFSLYQVMLGSLEPLVS